MTNTIVVRIRYHHTLAYLFHPLGLILSQRSRLADPRALRRVVSSRLRLLPRQTLGGRLVVQTLHLWVGG